MKAVLAAVARLAPGFELITIYYGEDATSTRPRRWPSASARRRRASRTSSSPTAASPTTGT